MSWVPKTLANYSWCENDDFQWRHMLTRSDDVNYCVTEHHAWLCSTCTVVGLAGYSGACPAPWAVDIMPRKSVTVGHPQGGTVINCTLPVCPLVPSITQERRHTKPKTGVKVAYVKIQAHEVTLSADKLLVTPAQIVAEFETSNSMKTSLSRQCTCNGRWYFETKSQRSVSKCVVTGERLFSS